MTARDVALARRVSLCARASAAAAIVAFAVSGCATGLFGHRVADPLSPEQSKAQVVDAARDLVGTLDLDVGGAYFWHTSCNDQGEAPFRGEVRIDYPAAPSLQQSEAEIAAMAVHLKRTGWSSDTDFRSHGTVLQKDDVVAVLGPQNVSTPGRDIRLYGQCRDVTTAKPDARAEAVTLD